MVSASRQLPRICIHSSFSRTPFLFLSYWRRRLSAYLRILLSTCERSGDPDGVEPDDVEPEDVEPDGVDEVEDELEATAGVEELLEVEVGGEVGLEVDVGLAAAGGPNPGTTDVWPAGPKPGTRLA